MMAPIVPLTAVHWADVGATGWTVRFYALRGEEWPGADLVALGQALGLSLKQRRRAGREYPGSRRRLLCFNRNGKALPVTIGSASAAAGLFAVARAVGKPSVDEAEQAFGEAFEEAARLMRAERAA